MPITFLPFEMTFSAPWSTARVASPDWQEVAWQDVTQAQAPVTNLASPPPGKSWQVFQVIWRPRGSTPELADQGATAVASIVAEVDASTESPPGGKILSDDEDGRP